MCDHAAGAVLLAAIWAAPLVGQERVEIVPDEGRIVLGGIEWGSSLILDRDDRVLERVFMGVHADSAIVYHRHTRSREVGGRTVEAVEDLAYRITLSPLRHIDGEPCLTRSDR